MELTFTPLRSKRSLSTSAESGGSSYPGIGPVLRNDDRDFRTALVHTRLRQLLTDAPEKFAHQLSQSSAKNKYIRFEQINYVPRPNRQKIRCLLQHVDRNRIALVKRFSHDLRGYVVQFPAGDRQHFRFGPLRIWLARPGITRFDQPHPRASCNRRAGTKRLDTASLSAAALRPVVVDGDMAALGRASRSAVINMPVKYNSSSDARAKRRVKNVPVTNASAPNRFCQRGRISVVVHSSGQSKDALHFGSQWKISPAGHIGRIEYHSSYRIERARRANPDSCQAGAQAGTRRKDLFDRGSHRGETFAGGSTRRHRNARLKKYAALRIDQACCYFRSANVHTERNCACGGHGLVLKTDSSFAWADHTFRALAELFSAELAR